MFRPTVALVILLLAPLPAIAQETGVAMGQRLAQTVCSECHQVEVNPATASPNPDAPRFADVARLTSTTELSIRVFLRSTHPTMPNLLLSPQEIDSIAAYILDMARNRTQ